jgi:hypothetical protein
MSLKLSFAFRLLVFCSLIALWPKLVGGQTEGATIKPLCTPKITASGVTSKAANGGQVKTGQRSWPGTWVLGEIRQELRARIA